MASERTEELYRVLVDRGYPEELCARIAYEYMNTDYTATRMLGYLYRKKEIERAQEAINEIYRNGL